MLFILCLLSFFIFANADSSESFRMVTNFTASPLDLDDINYISYDSDTSVGVYKGDDSYSIQAQITEEGYLQVTAGGYLSNNTYVYIDSSNGAVSVSNTSKSGPFVIQDSVLYYKGSASFYINEVDAAETYDLYWGTSDNDLLKTYTLLLTCVTAEGNRVEDYSPDEASTTYSLTTTTLSSSSSSSATGSTSSSQGEGAILQGNSWGVVIFASIMGLII